jgi:putative oxidoreductase
MRLITIFARVLLGLLFVVFGSNGFIHFIKMPPMSGPSGEFIGAMASTGYLQVIAGLQVLGGALLIIGRFVPLGLTLLGPIIVNILLFHIFLNHEGLGTAVCVCAVWAFLFWSYRPAFAAVLRP